MNGSFWHRAGSLTGVAVALLTVGCTKGSSAAGREGLAPTEVTSVTSVLSPGNTVLSLNNNEVIVDFGADQSLLGKRVGLAKGVDAARSGSAKADQGILAAEISSEIVYSVSAESQPATNAIAIGVKTPPGTSMLPPGRAPILYYWVEAPDGDGMSAFSPLDSTYDSEAGTLTALLPVGAFQGPGAGGPRAHIKLGIAQTFASPTTPSQLVAALSQLVPPQAAQPATMGMPCPFAPPGLPATGGCVERSMYNPARNIPSISPAHPHNGIDLAGDGVPIYAVPGAIVNRGNTSAAHEAELASGVAEASTGGQWGKGGGIWVVLDLPGTGASLKYLHLSELSPALGSPTLAVGKVVDSGAPIGRSGSTGSASKSGPHLHMELYVPAGKVCRKATKAGPAVCEYVKKQVDPFGYVAATFQIDQPSDTVLAKGKRYTLTFSAYDSVGSRVASSVQGAYEWNETPPWLDPTRKVCVWADPPDAFMFQSGAQAFAGPGTSTCFPWGSTVTAIAATDVSSASVRARHTVDPAAPASVDPLSPLPGGTVSFAAPPHWAGDFHSTACSSLPADSASGWYWEAPCFALGPIAGSYGGRFYFDDASADVVFGDATSPTLVEDVRRVMPLSWRSTDTTFGYSVPIQYSLSLSSEINASGMRVVTFTVANRTATTMSGTFQVSTTSGYFTDINTPPSAWKTVITNASGPWSASLVQAPRPRPQMNGFDFCFRDGRGWHQMSMAPGSGCNPRITPGWCSGAVQNGCVF